MTCGRDHRMLRPTFPGRSWTPAALTGGATKTPVMYVEAVRELIPPQLRRTLLKPTRSGRLPDRSAGRVDA